MVKWVMGRVGRPANASTVLLPPGATELPTPSNFTRASVANYTNKYGLMASAAIDVARINYSTLVATNYMQNPRFEGGAFGVTPTTYAFSSIAGVVMTVLGVGTDASTGLPYVDVRYQGTPTVDGSITMFLTGTGYNIPAVLGETISYSGYLMRLDGTLTSLTVGGAERDGGGGFTSNQPSIPFSVGSTPSYFERSRTMAGALTTGFQPTINNPVTAGTPVNYTVRLMGLQGARAANTSPYVALPPPGTIGVSSLFSGNRVLIEAARTNLAWPSADMRHLVGVWQNARGAVALAAGIAPDGTNTANRFTEDVALGGHGVLSVFTSTVSTAYTVSVYAKAGTRTAIQINLDQTAYPTGPITSIDLLTGVVTGTTATRASTTYAGNGWWRCSITHVSDAVATSARMLIIAKDGGGSANYTGDGVSYFDVWGAQLEVGNQPTSLMTTTTVAVARALDVWNIPTVGLMKYGTPVVNLMLQSQTIDNATWVKGRLNVTPDAIAAPDTSLTADKLYTDLTAASTHITNQTVSITLGQVYTYSGYFKAAEYAAVRLSTGVGFPAGSLVNFDLSGAGSLFAQNGASGTIQALASGWYRCSMTVTANLTTSAALTIALLQSAGTSQAFDGDGVSGIYAWGMQFETGAYASSYSPTTTVASTPRTKLAPGTVVVRSRIPYLPVVSDLFAIFSLTNGSTFHRVGMRYGPGVVAGSWVTQSITNPASGTLNNPAVNTDYTAALSWDDSGIAYTITGGTVQSLIGPMPNGITTLHVGQLSPAANLLNGEVDRVVYYPYKMTPAQLQAVTA